MESETSLKKHLERGMHVTIIGMVTKLDYSKTVLQNLGSENIQQLKTLLFEKELIFLETFIKLNM